MTESTQNKTMDNRIKLAKVRGWHGINDRYIDRDTNLYVLAGFPPDVKSYGARSILPDPFTDANDDYAVLEWMRENEIVSDWRSVDLLACGSYHYRIGDYARAALKVLSHDEA